MFLRSLDEAANVKLSKSRPRSALERDRVFATANSDLIIVQGVPLKGILENLDSDIFLIVRSFWCLLATIAALFHEN